MCSLNLNPHALCMNVRRFVLGNKDSTKMTGSRMALSKRGLSIEQANAKSQLVTSRCDRVRGEV